ncbi:aminoacyl-tRNA hydrolase [archaeon]|nr:aminoacyl-tRNA hydrolase [archaeon]|tara:strand:+ start:255 stop:593 length:339 start_codon:yes stop_codon:yes gene_type:complete
MKQAILIRQDLKMPKGKLATQCAHASVDAVLKSSKSKIEEWKFSGSKKVVLKVQTLDELKKYLAKAKSQKLTIALIKDAGKTVFKKPTITCLGIGPDKDGKLDSVISKLKLL